jgi:hypothetical protein
MEQRTRGRQQVDLFNFSFLDILACVIGLLIFILTIVVISGAGASAPARAHARKLSAAEHAARDARRAAGLAADRRTRAEQLLGTRAGQVIDPKAAADLLERDIDAYRAETERLGTSIARAEQQTASIHADIDRARRGGDVPSPDVAAVLAQANDLGRQADATAARAAALKAAARPKQVRYYLPVVRDSQRHAAWVEISGDRLWCVQSDDYRRIPDDISSTRFVRNAGARGTSVSAMVAGEAAVPSPLSDPEPSTVVISALVRPDGYAAFRKLREWAWAKGYAVYWEPSETDEQIVLTRAAHSREQ